MRSWAPETATTIGNDRLDGFCCRSVDRRRYAAAPGTCRAANLLVGHPEQPIALARQLYDALWDAIIPRRLLGNVRARWAAPRLLAFICDSSQEIGIRKWAAVELGLTRSERAFVSLKAIVLEGVESQQRQLAARALGWTFDPRAVDVLSLAVSNQREEAAVRAQAAESLGPIRNPAAQPGLIAALDDPSAEIRFWSAYALGEIGDSEALPSLRNIVSDKRTVGTWGEVSTEALDAMDRISRRVGEQSLEL